MTQRLRKAALAYAGFNCRVFPVVAQGKLPSTKRGYQDASADPEQIRAWWESRPDANIGFACGPSGYIALDADPARLDADGRAFVADLEQNYPTATQDTPTGGAHYLYELPSGVALGNSAGRLPQGIDVRVNGYILLSPSVVTYRGDDAAAKGVPDGFSGRYAWRAGMRPNEFPPQPLPDHVLELLKPKERAALAAPVLPPSAARQGADRYAAAALEKELDTLARAPVGERNEQLNKSAFSLGQLVAGGALAEGEVADKLATVAGAIGLDEREIERTIASGLRGGAQSPRAAPEVQTVVFHTNGNGVGSEAKPKRGRPKMLGLATLIRKTIADLGYAFKLNLLAERIEHADGSALHDGEQATLIGRLVDLGLTNKQLMLDMILADAWEHRYNPLHDFFNHITWDGRDHIAELSYFFTDRHPAIVYPDGHTSTVFAAWLRRWLIGAAGKAFDPIQNPMLVLAAEQGLGKSEFAKWLCSPLPSYFVESSINPENVDHQRWVTSNLIWEVGELGATTRKADVEALKAFITRHEHTYRVPYAKNEVHKAARASFIGTINPDNAGFLVDATGNRRFLTVEMTAIHWHGYLGKIDIRQVWAQAIALYRQDNNAWKLDETERALRDDINVEFDMEDPVRDVLLAQFDITPCEAMNPDALPFCSSTEIVQVVGLHVRTNSTRSLQMDIGRAMKRLGAVKGKRNNTNGYFGVTRRFAANLPT